EGGDRLEGGEREERHDDQPLRGMRRRAGTSPARVLQGRECGDGRRGQRAGESQQTRGSGGPTQATAPLGPQFGFGALRRGEGTRELVAHSQRRGSRQRVVYCRDVVLIGLRDEGGPL